MAGNERRLAGLFAVLVLLTTITGCWSYKEIDDLMIVSGLAIDKGEKDGEIMLTVEIVDVESATNSNSINRAKVISLSGKSMFDIVRTMISMIGKRLYWSHAKTIIISKDIAREGVAPYLDWFCRDTETRADMYIMITKDGMAKDILHSTSVGRQIVSFEASEILRNQKSVGKAPIMEIWDMVDQIERAGKTPIAPLVYLSPYKNRSTVTLEGSAIMELGKYRGALNGEETLYCQFVKDEIKGGVLLIDGANKANAISLEILKNKTSLKLIHKKDRLPSIAIKVKTDVSMDEIRDEEPFMTVKDREAIERRVARALEYRIEDLITRIQEKYGSDIFGFGAYLHEHDPKLWRTVENNWREAFTQLDVNVSVEVHLRSTAKTSRSIQVRE
ncbi:Ger(x)C family spore germination protein [Gorillibacterium timonense]|uniref:Ger(x)C family spore germination protein n=1 Tax=Gorillibacterium timonense TaxID=1689269 RepID=UPI00071E416B|nr:Ger(x)C family spore germination protein [Gorillibacterium timonense]